MTMGINKSHRPVFDRPAPIVTPQQRAHSVRVSIWHDRIGIAIFLIIVAGFAAAHLCGDADEKHDPRCDGPARYEAMREAYEAGRPQPC